MSGRILLVLLAAAGALGCARRSGDNNLVEMNLKGRVKSIHEVGWVVRERLGKVEKVEPTGENLRTSFTPRGYVSEVVNYGSDGTVLGRMTNSYDERDRQLESASYAGSGALVSKTVFNYEGGRLSSVSMYTASDSLINNNVVTSDPGSAKDIPSKYEIFDGAGNLLLTREFEYDGSGHLVREVVRDAESDVTTVIVITRRGDLVLSRRETKGRLTVKFDYEYDGNKNVVGITGVDEAGSVDKVYVEYEYDALGNWTRQTMLRGDNRIPVEMVERTIEYYED